MKTMSRLDVSIAFDNMFKRAIKELHEKGETKFPSIEQLIESIPAAKIVYKETYNRFEFESYPDVIHVLGRVYRKIDNRVEIMRYMVPADKSAKDLIGRTFHIVERCKYCAIYELS